ncbi:uncharacterized protein [Procambarus clarkii]|uniref:uncharacterized protein n=1 Tax=Procambarus clarkii TaxID=6728 RepID=UPI003742CFBF
MFQRGVGSIHFKNPLRYPFTDARLLEDVLDIMDGRRQQSSEDRCNGASRWEKALGDVKEKTSGCSSSSSDDGIGSSNRRRRRKRRPKAKIRTKAETLSSEPVDPLVSVAILRRTDTDDSDMEGTLSNISRQVMRPPGCSGKAKRGHLCFDASFETGLGKEERQR